jgi:hypothetical protein
MLGLLFADGRRPEAGASAAVLEGHPLDGAEESDALAGNDSGNDWRLESART